MKHLDELKELLMEQVKKITKKGDITVSELDSVYKVVDVIKDIDTINAMEEEYGGSGYSQRGGYSGRSYDGWSREGMSNRGSYAGGSYNGGSYAGGGSYEGSYAGGSYDGRRGRDADNDGRYSEDGGNSYRRGRDSRGRYMSRDAGKEQMMSTLHQMMDQASSEKERQAIMQCIEKLED